MVNKTKEQIINDKLSKAINRINKGNFVKEKEFFGKGVMINDNINKGFKMKRQCGVTGSTGDSCSSSLVQIQHVRLNSTNELKLLKTIGEETKVGDLWIRVYDDKKKRDGLVSVLDIFKLVIENGLEIKEIQNGR